MQESEAEQHAGCSCPCTGVVGCMQQDDVQCTQAAQQDAHSPPTHPARRPSRPGRLQDRGPPASCSPTASQQEGPPAAGQKGDHMPGLVVSSRCCVDGTGLQGREPLATTPRQHNNEPLSSSKPLRVLTRGKESASCSAYWNWRGSVLPRLPALQAAPCGAARDTGWLLLAGRLRAAGVHFAGYRCACVLCSQMLPSWAGQATQDGKAPGR